MKKRKSEPDKFYAIRNNELVSSDKICTLDQPSASWTVVVTYYIPWFCFLIFWAHQVLLQIITIQIYHIYMTLFCVIFKNHLIKNHSHHINVYLNHVDLHGIQICHESKTTVETPSQKHLVTRTATTGKTLLLEPSSQVLCYLNIYYTGTCL